MPDPPSEDLAANLEPSLAIDDAGRGKARFLTVTDLIVLILGFALALAFPWYNAWTQRPLPVLEPRWRVVALFFEEAVEKASLALIPLMLYRRVRLGGPCRPGELLLVVSAACALDDQFGRAFNLGIEPPGVVVAGRGYWSILAAIGTATLAAVGGLYFLRERLSDCGLAFLLVVAVAGSYPWPTTPVEAFGARLSGSAGVIDSPVTEYILFVGFYALENLVPAVIGVAACWDAIRGLRNGALAGIGLVMAAINLILCLALYLPGHFTSAFPPWDDPLRYILLAAPISSGVLGCVFFHLLGRPWRRWLASG